MNRTILLRGRVITYELERKPVKNLNLRIRADGSVHVSVNRRVGLAQVERFLTDKANFLLSAIDRYEAARRALPPPKEYIDGETFPVLGEPLRLKVIKGKANVTADGSVITLSVPNPDDLEKKRRVLTTWLQNRCEEVVLSICREVYPRFNSYGIGFPEIRFRRMVSRWGSCQPKRGILTFNYALIGAPLACIEYVVYHEFTHFLQPNHSAQFYGKLSGFLPDWKERKLLLEAQMGLIQR